MKFVAFQYYFYFFRFLILIFFSSVQHECIPQAVLGMDILCQAKSGMGKTAVFVLATLQQLDVTDDKVYVLVMCHTRELAFQISKEYERFSKYMSNVRVSISNYESFIVAIVHGLNCFIFVADWRIFWRLTH